MSRSFDFARVSVSLAMLLLAVPRALAGDDAPSSSIDRLHHPPGTVTGRAGIAHVERRGKGPVPLVLLPGAPFGWKAWEGFMKRNEAKYTMWAVTPAGYDQTPPPAIGEHDADDFTRRPWTDALVADLAALIEKEIAAPGKLGPAVVVGHHLMSDYYAVRLAHEHPSLVRAVVSVAGLGAFPVPPNAGPPGPETRARWVAESRVPFFRTVRQDTWNANTFPASALSTDADRGDALFEEEVEVPIETQLHYYLEYATDDVEPHVSAMSAPLLALQLKPKMSFEGLSQSMKDQLVKKFGSLDAAKKAVRFGGPWETLLDRLPHERVRLENVADSGSFMMDDAPAALDDALAKFLAEFPAAPEKSKDG